MSPTKGAKPIKSSTPTQGGLITLLLFFPTHIYPFTSWEFGGPWGVTAMMIGFPMLMYYLWICLWFYDGRLVFPTSIDGIKPFISDMWAHIRDVSFSPFWQPKWWQKKSTIVSPIFPFV
jgi:hypothetical protein